MFDVEHLGSARHYGNTFKLISTAAEADECVTFYLTMEELHEKPGELLSHKL